MQVYVIKTKFVQDYYWCGSQIGWRRNISQAIFYAQLQNAKCTANGLCTPIYGAPKQIVVVDISEGEMVWHE